MGRSRSGSKRKTVMVSLYVQCCYSVSSSLPFFSLLTSDAKKNFLAL